MRRQLVKVSSTPSVRAQLAASVNRFSKVTLSAGGTVLGLWLFSGLLAPGNAAAATVPPLVASTHSVTKTAATKTDGGGKDKHQPMDKKKPAGKSVKSAMKMEKGKALAKLTTDGSTPGSKKYWAQQNQGAAAYWSARAEQVEKYRESLKPVKGQAGRDRKARQDLVDDQRKARQDAAKAQRAQRQEAADLLRTLKADPKFRKAYLDAMRANDKKALAALRAEHAAKLDAVRKQHAAELAQRREERAAAKKRPVEPTRTPVPTAGAGGQDASGHGLSPEQQAAAAAGVTAALTKAATNWLANVKLATQRLLQWVGKVVTAVHAWGAAAAQHTSK